MILDHRLRLIFKAKNALGIKFTKQEIQNLEFFEAQDQKKIDEKQEKS